MTDVIDTVAPVLDREPVPAEPTTTPETAAEDKEVVLKQSALNALIKSRQATSLKRAAALEKQLEQLKAQVVGGSPDASEVERLRAEISAKEIENARMREESIAAQKSAFITAQAQREDFIDVALVEKLTRDNLRWDADTKAFAVVGDDGQVRITADGSPLSPAAFYKEFAEQRPYLVHGRTPSGTNQSGSMNPNKSVPPALDWRHYIGPNSSSRDANALAQRDPRAYAEMRRQAKAAGVIQ